MLKGLNRVITVTNLEDMVKLHNHNMEAVAKDICNLARKQKTLGLFSMCLGAGLFVLYKESEKQSKKIDRLEEKHKNLYEDYHSYVMANNGEYDPSKDDETY